MVLTKPEALLADFLRRGSASSASGSMDCIGKFKFNRTGRKFLDALDGLPAASQNILDFVALEKLDVEDRSQFNKQDAKTTPNFPAFGQSVAFF